MMLLIFFVFMTGILCGVIAENLRLKIIHKPVGILRIDASDPDENPYMFLELEAERFHKFTDGGCIELTVKTENYISHE